MIYAMVVIGGFGMQDYWVQNDTNTRLTKNSKRYYFYLLTSQSVLVLVCEHNDPILLDGDGVGNRGQVGPRAEDDYERSEGCKENDVTADVPLQRKHQRYDDRTQRYKAVLD